MLYRVHLAMRGIQTDNISSPLEENQSSSLRPVKFCSDFSSFYLELYQNKFKNLIQTNKFIFSLTVNRRVIILVWMAIEHASLLLCTSHPVNVSYNTNKMFLFNITLTGDFSKWCHKKMRVSYLKNTSNHSVK
jgi:hypothetical protein